MPPLRRLLVVLVACAVFGSPRAAGAAIDASPLAALQSQLALVSSHAPGHVAIAVEDLATGMSSGINQTANMPAASTIKIPVMVEVFRRMERGDVELEQEVTLRSGDRDDGWGALADAPAGRVYSVRALLWAMITDSDNTATNMLIRLVGRPNVNATMATLGLRQTRLTDYLRSNRSSIRYGLRTSPRDMISLLALMARDKLIDAWSSREMLAILDGQTHNGLLPQPLPHGVAIAHKTGTLHDTLNDVGIVYLHEEPYAIAVMTTDLPTLSAGRSFIRRVSLLAYDSFSRFAQWRQTYGYPAFAPDADPASPLRVPALAPGSALLKSNPPSAPAAAVAGPQPDPLAGENPDQVGGTTEATPGP